MNGNRSAPLAALTSSEPIRDPDKYNIVSQKERKEIFCELKKILTSDTINIDANLRKQLNKLMIDDNFGRELYFHPNSGDTNNLQCFIKKIMEDPQSISFFLHTVANVGSLAAFIVLYKKYNDRQKVNHILGFASAFSKWGVHAHQLWKKNSCHDC